MTSCKLGELKYDNQTGDAYVCVDGKWTVMVSGGGGDPSHATPTFTMGRDFVLPCTWPSHRQADNVDMVLLGLLLLNIVITLWRRR